MMLLRSRYPNLVRLFGYSSRSQRDKDAYVKLLDMRIKAKHKQLSEEVLKPLGLSNDDLKVGLKLPLNAYTGALRASFNNLADNLQGFSICTTGQLFILQLIHDLREIPTLEMVSANTDAVMYEIDEEYQLTKFLNRYTNEEIIDMWNDCFDGKPPYELDVNSLQRVRKQTKNEDK